MPRRFVLYATALLIAALAAASGCAPAPEARETPGAPATEVLGSQSLSVATEVRRCGDLLGGSRAPQQQRLPAGNIRLLSWNVKKGALRGWQNDHVDLAADRDLVLIQEAVLRPDFTKALPGLRHWAFAPDYEDHKHRTGVMTLSRAAVLAVTGAPRTSNSRRQSGRLERF